VIDLGGQALSALGRLHHGRANDKALRREELLGRRAAGIFWPCCSTLILGNSEGSSRDTLLSTGYAQG